MLTDLHLIPLLVCLMRSMKTVWTMKTWLILMLVFLIVDGVHISTNTTIVGTIKRLPNQTNTNPANRSTTNNCDLDCQLPSFLETLCRPLKPYLHCKKSFQDIIKKLHVKALHESVRCNCVWREVFNHGRVHKVAFEKIVDFVPYNRTKKVRVRLSSLGRECQNFNNYLCDGSMREAQEKLSSKKKEYVFGFPQNKSNFETAKVFMYEDGWGMLASRPKDLVGGKSNAKKVEKKDDRPNREETMLMWFGIAGGVAIMIMCTFFLARMKKDSHIPTPGEGSLDKALSPDKRVTSWDSLLTKLRSEKKAKASEKEKLLGQKSASDGKRGSKSDKDKSGSNGNIKCTQCGNEDFSVSVTSFISNEDTQAKTLTKTPMAESESDGEEARLFHSKLMYGQSETSSK